MEIGREDNFEKSYAGDCSISDSRPDVDGFKPIVCGSGSTVKEEKFKPDLNLSQAAADCFKPIDCGGYTVKVEEDELKLEEMLSRTDVNGFKPIVCGSELAADAVGRTAKVEKEELNPEGKQSLSIADQLGKVSLVGGIEKESSSAEESERDSSFSSGSSSSEDSESGSASSSRTSSSEDSGSEGSSSSTSSDADEEEEEENNVKVNVGIQKEVDGADELEEGEIRGIDGEMVVAGTDDDEKEEDETEDILGALGIEYEEIVDDDDEADAGRGPIRSKNELEVLPPVPPLDVSLQPHHQMLPVGYVLSMVGTKVIVEGREQHNPLNEGSILWITIDRAPLGYVDEIFGPVKNPYYAVRYNSESEVPAGIHEGTLISFVPEFANHVLNDQNVYKKGYDASGENDEELSDNAEFSDDEKEAEYKRMQKMTKRGMNDQRMGKGKSNKKKVKSKNGAWKNDRNSAQETSTAVGQLPPTLNQHNFSLVSVSLDKLNCSRSAVGEQKFGGSGILPPFSVMSQSSGIVPPLNGVWTNGMPGVQPQNANFLNRFSAEGMPLLSQNYQQQPVPLPTPALSMPTMMPYQQQHFDPSLSYLPNMVLPSGQPNLFAGPAPASWLGIAGQNVFNETTFAMGIQGARHLSPLQGILANGPVVNLQMANANYNLQPKGEDDSETSQNFNMGASSSHRKKSFHKAGGGRGRGRGCSRSRVTGGRGPQQS